tara:strand:- start:5074 stop:5235 length:162 start_codon:yes stop_codon:yes gene_type:complete
MVKKILLALLILLILPIVSAESIDDKINSIVKYGEQYDGADKLSPDDGSFQCS